MIEMYIFINPLGGTCLDNELRLLSFLKSNYPKVKFQFLPLLNLRVMQEYFYRHQAEFTTIQKRNLRLSEIYTASLDYKAAGLQGKRKGRSFLLAVQEATGKQHRPYTDELVREIVAQLHLDADMFFHDRHSSFVKQAFELDQCTAQEMGVKHFSSAVVFNYACDRDYGVLVEDACSLDILKELFQTKSNPSMRTRDAEHFFNPPNTFGL